MVHAGLELNQSRLVHRESDILKSEVTSNYTERWVVKLTAITSGILWKDIPPLPSLLVLVT